MITHREVFEAALRYKDVPWKHQGRSDKGIDCLGLVVRVAIDLGLPGTENALSIDTRDYSRVTPMGICKELMNGGMLRASKPISGAVVVFAQGGTYTTHLGILGSGRFELELVHAYAPSRRVVHHVFDDGWRKNARAFFLYPGVTYG